MEGARPAPGPAPEEIEAGLLLSCRRKYSKSWHRALWCAGSSTGSSSTHQCPTVPARVAAVPSPLLVHAPRRPPPPMTTYGPWSGSDCASRTSWYAAVHGGDHGFLQGLFVHSCSSRHELQLILPLPVLHLPCAVSRAPTWSAGVDPKAGGAGDGRRCGAMCRPFAARCGTAANNGAGL